MKEIPQSKVWLAYRNWIEFCDTEWRTGGCHPTSKFSSHLSAWENFLGEKITWLDDGIKITDEAARKIELLNGPHWYSILKAHYINEGT